AHETTNNSTWQVADIRSGGSHGMANDITVMGTRLYFGANDGTGEELWAHETTNNSTWQVADIRSGGAGNPEEMTVVGTRLYFSATDGTGDELWVHETTNSSTWVVTDFASTWGALHRVQVVHEASFPYMGTTRLYFEAYEGSAGSHSGAELWMMEIVDTITYD
ncbi:MAG: hypothetical protein VX627_04740, partial [Candidatus Thermoplasmatota archaeon]|nr:hypothetical protein [Candidatus Thermoplasmatota archaeon]